MITCALSPEQLRKLRVYNIAKLLGKIERNEPFDLKQHLTEIYQAIYDRKKDHNTALDYARLSSVLLGSIVGIKELRPLLKKGFDPTAIVLLAEETENPDTGLQATSDFLGIDMNKKQTAEIIKQAKAKQEQIRKAEEKNSQGVPVLTKDTLKPNNPVTTTIDETLNATDESSPAMAYYTTFVKKLLQAGIPGDFQPVPYPGVEGGLVLKMIQHNRIPVEQLHPNIKEDVKAGEFDSTNAQHYNSGFVFVITDVNGKEIFFNDNYDVVESGKLIYFKTRNLPKKAEGKFDLTGLKNVQSPAELSNNLGITVEEASQYLQESFELLEQSENYLRSNPEGSIRFSITGGSLGAVVDHPAGEKTFVDINQLKAPITELKFFSSGKKNKTAYSGSYAHINGADYALQAREVSEEDADKLAELLLAQELVDDKGRAVNEKGKLAFFTSYISPSPESGLVVNFNKETGLLEIIITKNGVSTPLKQLPSTYAQDKKALVEAILNMQTSTGKTVKRKYSIRTSDFNNLSSVEFFTLEDTSTGKKVTPQTLNREQYIQYAVKSINANLDTNGIPKRFNAYFSVMPLEAEGEKLLFKAPEVPKPSPTPTVSDIESKQEELNSIIPIKTVFGGGQSFINDDSITLNLNWKDKEQINFLNKVFGQPEWEQGKEYPTYRARWSFKNIPNAKNIILDIQAEKITTDPYKYQVVLENIDKLINAKYDAELSALQPTTPVSGKKEVTQPTETKPSTYQAKKDAVAAELKTGATITGFVQKPTGTISKYEFVRENGDILEFYNSKVAGVQLITPEDLNAKASLKLVDKVIGKDGKEYLDVVEVYIGNKYVGNVRVTADFNNNPKTEEVVKKVEETTKQRRGRSSSDTNLDKFNEDFLKRNKNKLQLQQSVDATVEQIAAAKVWYEKSPLSKHIPFEVMFNAVNIKTRGSIATWNVHGITLWKGSDYSDLYHEAWHGFTQMFMTQTQRTALYKEAAKQSGTFTSYLGREVAYSEATEDELEEKMAEDFREYMLKKQTIAEPVKRSFFQKIWDMLKALFGKTSVVDAVDNFTGNPVIDELYTKLRVGNLTNYTFSQANYQGKSYQSRRNSGITNYEDLQLLSDSIDSLFAELIEKLNRRDNTKIYTSSLIKDVWGRKMAYNYVQEQFTNRLEELYNERQELSDTDFVDDIDYEIDLLTKALINFGNINDMSNPGGLIADHMSISKMIEFEDRLVDEEIDVTKRNEFESRSGNEVGMQQLADPSLIYAIRSLRKYDKSGKRVTNRLGFDQIADFDSSWKRIVNITKGSKDVTEIYDKLKAVSEDFPIIKDFLNNIGDPNNQERSSQNLWTEIEKICTMPEIQLLSIQFKMVNGKVSYITPVIATGEFLKIGQNWNNAFATAETGDFIKKDAGKINSLNIVSVLRAFPKGITQENLFEFMEAVGMPLEDTPSARAAAVDPVDGILSEVRAVYRALKEGIYKYNQNTEKPIVITRPTDILKDYRKVVDTKNDSLLGELSGASTKMNKLMTFQLKWSDAVTSSVVSTTEGKSKYERSLRSSVSNMITDINAADNIIELTQENVENAKDNSMSHLSKDRNPFSKSLLTLHRLFDKQGNKRKSDNGQPVKLQLFDMDGVQVLQQEINGIIESSGISTADSDFNSRFLNEFYSTMLYGTSIATQHADKSTAYLYRVVETVSTDTGFKQKVHYIDPNSFTVDANNGSVGISSFVSIMTRYLASEYERIRKLKSGDPAGDVTVGKSNYRKTGSEFVVFDKILSDTVKNKLKGIYSPGNPVNTAEQFISFLNKKENENLLAVIEFEIQNYLTNQAQAVQETLEDIGFYNSSELMMPVFKKMVNTKKERAEDPAVQSKLKEAVAIAFAANSWIHKYESTMLFYGDPALYNGVDDFFKRNAGVAATGTFPRTDAGMLNWINSKLNEHSYAATLGKTPKAFGTTLTSAVLEDTNTVSAYYDTYVKSVKLAEKVRLESIGATKETIDTTLAEIDSIFKESYGEMKEGDGQGWITIDAYRSLLISMNKWTPYQEDLFVKIINGESISVEQIKQFLPVKKFQYWGPLQTDGLPVMGFHKFSLMPLLPNAIKDRNLDILHKKMVEQGVDYALFKSGSKINTITTNGKVDKFYVDNTSNTDRTAAFANADYKFTPNNIYLRYFKDQVDVQDSYKGKVTFASQMRKLIEYGLYENGVPLDWKPEIKNRSERIKAWKESSQEEKETSANYKIVTEYENTLSEYMDAEMEALRKEIGGDNTKLAEFIRKELTRKELADHTIDFIEVDPATNKFKHDLDLSLDADNIEKMLVALIQKRLINGKFKGEGLIQVSGAGYEKTDRVIRAATPEELARLGTNGLPFYSNKAWEEWANSENPTVETMPKGNNTQPIGVMISMQGDFKKLLRLREVRELALKEGIEPLAALNILIKDEKWLSQGDNRKFVTTGAVRIPDQGPNAKLYGQIREFLPESSGNIVVLPAEIVAQAGSDFDIDKLFSLFYNIKSKVHISPEIIDIISGEMGTAVTIEMVERALSMRENENALDVFDQQILDIFDSTAYEIETLELYKGKNRKGLQNKLLDIITEMMSRDSNFHSLITPNTTKTLETIARNMAEKIRGVKKGTVTSPTEIFEVLQNVNKHDANKVGKTILAIIAVANTFNTIFDRTGLVLDKTRWIRSEEQDSDKGPSAKMMQRLLLDHNDIDGKISMSSLYSSSGGKRIADLISQLINGSVDVAKGAWIFDIQGNKELINNLVFMVMAGVDAQQAIDFISQPIIKDYVELQRRYKSPLSLPIDKEEHGNLFRVHARDSILFDPKYGFPFDKSSVSSVINAGRADESEVVSKVKLYKRLEEYVTDNKDLITPESLSKNTTSDTFTDVDRVAFAHFLEIQEMANSITQITQNLNFDTTQTKTLFDARAKLEKVYDLDNGISYEYIKAIMEESPLGIFKIQPFIRKILHDLFPLRDNETVNSYIDSWYERKKTGVTMRSIKKTTGLEEDTDIIRKFRTDLISFIFQNAYYSFDLSSDTYNGQDVTYQIVEQRVLNTIAGVKDRVLYVDKKTLLESFKSGNYKNSNAWKYDVAPVDAEVFAMYDNDVALQLYTKFVYERETQRSRSNNSFENISKTSDFKTYYNEYVRKKEDNPEKKAYESVIRDRALQSLNLHAPLFYGENAYGLQIMELENLHPEMAKKYSFFNVIQADTAIVNKKQVTNLKFAGQPTPIQINRLHNDILDLANPSVIKVSDPVENLRISELFSRFSHYAIIQSGIDQRSAFSMIKAIPYEKFIAIVSEPRKQFLNNMTIPGKAQAILEVYTNMFLNQYSRQNSKLKNRIKNYAKTTTLGSQTLESQLDKMENVERLLTSQPEIEQLRGVRQQYKTLKEYADATSARFVNTREVLRKEDIEYYNDRVQDLIEGRLQYALFAAEDLKNKQYLPFINKLKENGFIQVKGMEHVFSKNGVNPKEEFERINQQQDSVSTQRTFKDEDLHQAYIKGGLEAVTKLIQESKKKELDAAKQLSKEVDMLEEFEQLNSKPNKTNSENDRLIELYTILKNSEELDFEYSLNELGLTTQQQGSVSSNQQVVSEPYGVVVAETNPDETKTQEFVKIIQPQILAQAYKENASGTANDMFMYGLRWTRKSTAKAPLNNKSYANGGLPITDAKAKDNYVYDTVDQNGNPLAPVSDLQPIIDEIQKNLGIDMSNYDAVIGNIYLPGQNIATHRDTTESLSARNYPVVVYTIGNNSGIGIYENEKNPGSASFASDKKTVIPTKNGTIYTFGMDGKGRFELAHDTPKGIKREQKFPPITLPNGNVVENYTITLTFRRAADLTATMPVSPTKLSGATQASVTTGFQGYKGGFENKGKGTPEGDGKDKAMRQIADGFIGEVLDRNKQTSSNFSAKSIYEKDKANNTLDYFDNAPTVVTYRETGVDGNKVIMLARNGELKNKPLSSETKNQIEIAFNNGGEFVVGDMPGVDSQFIDYLQQIGAKFTVYHTGNKSRIEIASRATKAQANQVSQISSDGKFKLQRNTTTGVITFSLLDGSALAEKHVKQLKEDYPEMLFVANGFNQVPGKSYNTAGTNSVYLSMGQDSADYIRTKTAPNASTLNTNDKKAFMTDDTYDQNIKMIDEDIERLKKSDKPLIFDASGYGQYMLGLNEITGKPFGDAVAPRTFVYLSSKLLSEFGYINPNYLKTTSGKKDIQNYQYVTDDQLIEQKKVCKLQ